RGIQSVRSPTIRWPTMSNALQVSFPSLQRTHLLGSPSNNAFRVAGVRLRTVTASARLNSVTLAMLGRCMPRALDSGDGVEAPENLVGDLPEARLPSRFTCWWHCASAASAAERLARMERVGSS